jgi:diaminopimelate decarboxylase
MAWIEKRMAQTNITNKSAFLRKMAIDGHVINLDVSQLSEIAKLLRITANNVNQIAVRVNSGGGAYRNDVAEVNAQLIKIREDFGAVLRTLTDVADAKPGKRFIPPPPIRDLPEYNQTADGA